MVEAITQNFNTTAVAQSSALDEKFTEIKNKQGVLGNIWNEIKEATGAGVSLSKCESVLEGYKEGVISFDDALDYINSFDKKQEEMTDLEANIVTGIGAIAVATCLVSGPIGWAAALLFGAPVGAALKSGIKLIDRATNKVSNDELDAKQITKDAISGAVVGTTSAVSSGVGAGIRAGSRKLAISNGAKCGAQCGALAGSTSYITNVAFDKDRKFNLQELAENTMTSTFVSGTVGGIVGAGMYSLSHNVGKEVSKSVKQTIVDDSMSSSSRKILGEAERTMMAIG